MDLYLKYPQPRTFAEDVALYEAAGYVWDTPEVFLMARPVWKDAPDEVIKCSHVRFHDSCVNAWFLFAFVGDLRATITIAPYQLAWVGWSRRMSPIRWHRMGCILDRIDRLTTINQNHICQTQK